MNQPTAGKNPVLAAQPRDHWSEATPTLENRPGGRISQVGVADRGSNKMSHKSRPRYQNEVMVMHQTNSVVTP
jgi:hypothetical protein